MDLPLAAGAFAVVFSTEEGDATTLQITEIKHIPDVGPIAVLSDGSQWGAETGAPLTRKWAGYKVELANDAYLHGRIAEVFERVVHNDTSTTSLAKLYNLLLELSREGR